LPSAAAAAGCYGILVDVKGKGSTTLFDHCSNEQLRSLVREAHDLGLQVGLAGGLGEKDVITIRALGADIMGVRRAVCTSREWVESKLDGRLVSVFAGMFRVTA
jgi:hypothetical protein